MLRLPFRRRPHDAVSFSYATAEFPPLTRAMIRTVEFVGGQRKLRRSYLEGREALARGEDFYDLAVRILGLDIVADTEMLARVPREGPVLFVANHPYGVLDGITLAWLIRRVRPDVKILAHGALCQLPEARSCLLPIDFAGTPEAQATTLASRIAAQKWLQSGHAIGIFPAGGVSTSLKPMEGPALDFAWAPFTAKLAMGAKATIVPIYFEGQNSRLFQLASHVSAALRLSLIFRETVRRMGTEVRVRVGEPIPYSDWCHLTTRDVLVAELRRRTFSLAPSGADHLMQEGRLRIFERKPVHDRATPGEVVTTETGRRSSLSHDTAPVRGA